MSGHGRPRDEVRRLLLAAVANQHHITDVELNEIIGHVADAGFDPMARETARRPLQGQVWRGQRINAKTRLPPEVRHWLLHACVNREWPPGTTLRDYTNSLRQVVLDPDSGTFINQYKGELSLGIIRETRELRGPGGYAWLLVQYRVATGHWTTAFQPAAGIDEIAAPEWGSVIWLRRPTIRSGLT